MASEIRNEIFLEKVLGQVPRILGLIDRSPASKTYGCADRYYWHYNLHDYSNHRMQEVSLLLCLLYKNNLHGMFFNNKKILDLAVAAVIFWSKTRNRDGSVNEVYPYEHSFCASAISGYAITESMLILDKPSIVDLLSLGNWLTRNDNILVSNQMAAAALTLYNIYLITNKDKFKYASSHKMNMLLAHQSKDGFFKEYGGQDIGYQSLTLSFLAKLFLKNKDINLKDAIDKGLTVIENALDDFGNFDYYKMSRRMQFLYPHSFIVFKRTSLINKIINGLERQLIINPSWLDDRYVTALTSDYLQAYLG